MQQGQPVAFCSRSLTEAETRYPQIDKELLAICFALNKFKNFVYGRKIVIKTDHKPLVSICSKDFHKVSSRLQRLKLKLLENNFEVEYLPGKLMFIADLLSRSFLKTGNKIEENVSYTIHTVDFDISLSDKKYSDIKSAVKSDPVLHQVLSFCEFGWPTKPKTVLDSEMTTYFKG